MDIRYQVFVSSTYTDLIEERREVMQALLTLDCIPAGMELFSAADEDQWEIIKEVIDLSDYYIVIVGGRYGSVTEEAISYTEKEYDYALAKGMPIYGFVHADPSQIPVGKSDISEGARARLEAFRAKVKSKPVNFYSSPLELRSHVTVAISRGIKKNIRPGWVRGNLAMTPETQAEISNLRAQVSDLTLILNSKDEVAAPSIAIEELAQLEDRFDLEFNFKYLSSVYGARSSNRMTVVPTWAEIFKSIAPTLMNEATVAEIDSALSQAIDIYLEDVNEQIPADYISFTKYDVFDNIVDDIIVQLFALSLIERGTKKRTISDQQKYWKLTATGQDMMMKLRAITKEQVWNADQIREALAKEVAFKTAKKRQSKNKPAKSVVPQRPDSVEGASDGAVS